MKFFRRNSHVSRAQVLMDSVLTAILTYFANNKDSLTREEAFSFMVEYSRLSVVRSNKGTKNSALTKALVECKALNNLFNGSLQRACIRYGEDTIRSGTVSPAATTIADTDSTHAPSTKLVDPNPIITSVDPSAQVLADIDSVLRDIHKYCIDNLDSLTQEERSSFMDENSSLADVLANEGATRSILLQTLDECKKLKLRIESACSRNQVLDFMRRRPASPATTIGMANTDSTHAPILPPRPTPPSERPISVQSNLSSTNCSHLGPSNPSIGTPSLTIPCDDYEGDDTSSITSAAFMEGSPCASFAPLPKKTGWHSAKTLF
ncbi:hypothetical protein P692DRAFT_20834662 [Suillus brevipes Sb2]|nr:hypothetical protein P692DRAFT_20834662 [Suillus brevipes Sb2]